MFGTTFYNETIRRTTIAFGTIFNNISVVSRDESQNELRRQKVGISYIPKRRYYQILEQESKIDRDSEDDSIVKTAGNQIILPRMSFAVTNVSYDAQRAIGGQQRIYSQSGSDALASTFPRVPYNVSFELGIYTKRQDDGFQIIEQILPYFQPSLSVTYRPVLSDSSYSEDIILNLEDTSPDSELEGPFDADLQVYIWTMSFTAQIWLYGPSTTSGVIKSAGVTFVNQNDGKNLSSVTVEVDPITAGAEDVFGFSTGIQILDTSDFELNTSGIC